MSVSQQSSERPTVLIVEDERHLADLYADYLPGEYAVRTAYGGKEGLDRLDESVDVVLLDRRMPVLSGNEVLARIEERAVSPRVAMVTAVDPEFDIIEMGVDDYLIKPVTEEEIREVVDRLLKISEYSDRLQDLTSKKLKRNVLEVEKSRSELRTSELFQDLQDEIQQLEETVDALAEELNVEERDLRL